MISGTVAVNVLLLMVQQKGKFSEVRIKIRSHLLIPQVNSVLVLRSMNRALPQVLFLFLLSTNDHLTLLLLLLCICLYSQAQTSSHLENLIEIFTKKCSI
jgi:hypothetical protein